MMKVFEADGTATSEKIAETIDNLIGRPCPKGTVANYVANIAGKLALDGYVISRTTKVGRGNKGQWILKRLQFK